jgi:hypothetical protein
MKVSLSQCERLTHRYGEVVEAASVSTLEALAERPLMATGQTHTMVVQADGVYVMERDKPLPGECEGREVKQVVIYPNSSPSERHSYASPAASDAFIPLAHGLLRWAGVKQRDQLVGVGDGAVWVDELFDTLGVERRILDVYHASGYLERVMVAMGWNETEREAERRAWLRGEVNGRVWFETYLPPPERCCQWDSEAQAALRYLLRRLDQMDYRDYKAMGWPIGSGQIEGANKAVIGARMKRGGMRWSKRGIPRMAALRSAQLSRRPLVNFHAARLEAFRQN